MDHPGATQIAYRFEWTYALKYPQLGSIHQVDLPGNSKGGPVPGLLGCRQVNIETKSDPIRPAEYSPEKGKPTKQNK